MVVGDPNYQLNLSRLAFSFKGSVSIEYLESVGPGRIHELGKHLKIIGEELKNG